MAHISQAQETAQA
jgi:hypothetical protein